MDHDIIKVPTIRFSRAVGSQPVSEADSRLSGISAQVNYGPLPSVVSAPKKHLGRLPGDAVNRYIHHGDIAALQNIRVPECKGGRLAIGQIIGIAILKDILGIILVKSCWTFSYGGTAPLVGIKGEVPAANIDPVVEVPLEIIHQQGFDDNEFLHCRFGAVTGRR